MSCAYKDRQASRHAAPHVLPHKLPQYIHTPRIVNHQEVGCPASSTLAQLAALHGVSAQSCADGIGKLCGCQRLTLEANDRVQARVWAYLGTKVTIVSVRQHCCYPGI